MSFCQFEGWITSDRARELFKLAAMDFEAAKKAALDRDFKPTPLGATARIEYDNAIRRVESRNVVAKVVGSDPKLKDEYLIYEAHWDHLGIGPAVKDDSIYNGAIDNATGVAGLVELARAYQKLGTKPKRSILFLAPTAEERGLLGSAFYAQNPLYPLAKTVAVINMDGMNMLGRTKDVTVIGLGKSTLDDDVARVAAIQGRLVKPDPEPQKGHYYRSDHFSFAKVGVPALDVGSGVDFVGKPADFGRAARERYVAEDYHKPSDEVRPDWVTDGVVEDLQLIFQVGLDVANAKQIPEWRPGDEFKAARDATMKGSRKR
jgi:Zn-dependent M28 family amino/carboxypeptidase